MIVFCFESELSAKKLNMANDSCNSFTSNSSLSADSVRCECAHIPQLRERHIDERVQLLQSKAVAHRALEAAQTRRLPREEAIDVGALHLVLLGHVAKIDLCAPCM